MAEEGSFKNFVTGIRNLASLARKRAVAERGTHLTTAEVAREHLRNDGSTEKDLQRWVKGLDMAYGNMASIEWAAFCADVVNSAKDSEARKRVELMVEAHGLPRIPAVGDGERWMGLVVATESMALSGVIGRTLESVYPQTKTEPVRTSVSVDPEDISGWSLTHDLTYGEFFPSLTHDSAVSLHLSSTPPGEVPGTRIIGQRVPDSIFTVRTMELNIQPNPDQKRIWTHRLSISHADHAPKLQLLYPLGSGTRRRGFESDGTYGDVVAFHSLFLDQVEAAGIAA